MLQMGTWMHRFTVIPVQLGVKSKTPPYYVFQLRNYYILKYCHLTLFFGVGQPPVVREAHVAQRSLSH